MLANAFASSAQQKLSGAIGPISRAGLSHYTHVNWEVSYKFEKRNDDIYFVYYNPRVSVPSHASYATPQKTYTKGDLGLSAWPQTNLPPASLNVQINCITPNGTTELIGVAISYASEGTYGTRVSAAKLGGKEIDLSAFKLTITKAYYSPQPIPELDNIINQKKTSNTTSANAPSSNNLNNSQNTNSTATSRTQPVATGLPANTSGNDPLANYTPSNAYAGSTKTEVYIQAGATILGSLVEQVNANYEKKMARWQAESDANSKRIQAALEKRQQIKFVTEFLPLIEQAQKGDENVKMLLYFASNDLASTAYVPQGEEWFNAALANNNTDALLHKANLVSGKVGHSGYNFENAIPYLKQAGALGSADAYVILGMYYDLSYNPGNESAIDYFKKAAELGSPNAMYYLGMIYKYGQTNDNKSLKKVFRKHNIVLDENISVDWFKKAYDVRKTFKQSLYSRSSVVGGLYFYGGASLYLPDTYDQLKQLYTKGKVVKDLVKAAELTASYSGIPKVNIIEYEKFDNINRYP